MRCIAVGLVAAATLALSVPAFPAVPDDVDSMSLREKVGQLVMFSVHGRALTAEERTAIERNHLGGVILFAKNYSGRAQLGSLTSQIQRAARRGNGLRIGALISVDQEGGVVKRFPDMPPRYSAPEMGEMNDTSIAYGQGRATARELRRAGVNVDLAPVADLDLPPEHVMASRSFDSGPRRVARLAAAFGKGLQSRTVAATAKHFPGLGGATLNTDDGKAYVYRSKRQLRRVDALPFHRLVDRGIRMMMLSHAMYVHDGGRTPASVSRYIATKRLRDEFGFTGVAISDALEPVAWRFGGSTSKACKATIRAGVDIALITGDVTAAATCARRIRNGVLRGEIPRARLDRAVTRVLALKRWLGL